jgi:glycosyltransferase involved in cell wall biosynthesis
VIKPKIHLINAFENINGGSERRTLTYFDLLRSKADVTLWSESEPDPQITLRNQIQPIRPWLGAFPRGGTMVFVGVYFRIGRWIRFAHPKRIVVIYNTDHPDKLKKRIKRLATSGTSVEIVSTSPGLSLLLGTPDLPILESPIDLTSLLNLSRPPRQKFIVGRLSRDDPVKHHEEDALLYRQLAENGCHVRIMGSSVNLYRELSGVPQIELLATGAESQIEFLRSLDCFIYRTSESWYETFGRVIFEAMASGLPVVCANRGGHIDYLRHGQDSFIFASTSDAFCQILRLRDDVELRTAIGRAASERAAEVVGEKLQQRTIDFFLGNCG